MSGRSDGQRTTSGAWLAGFVLGVLTGITTISFVLGILGLPILIASVGLMVWKGPRAVAGAGFLTGWGLLWTVAIASSTISCVTIERSPGSWCEPADGIAPFVAAGLVMLGAGLLASALLHRRRR